MSYDKIQFIVMVTHRNSSAIQALRTSHIIITIYIGMNVGMDIGEQLLFHMMLNLKINRLSNNESRKFRGHYRYRLQDKAVLHFGQ